ncbi:unnamed protein product [Trichogramma brassicae]|uniref:Uncharacterized protein n=1 Tax=Trichogramma brassicae TaxID=86971 RepID=A0A6H5HW14_9HYME|nr:unnamed protein product [Trichogramma brassicae]
MAADQAHTHSPRPACRPARTSTHTRNVHTPPPHPHTGHCHQETCSCNYSFGDCKNNSCEAVLLQLDSFIVSAQSKYNKRYFISRSCATPTTVPALLISPTGQ